MLKVLSIAKNNNFVNIVQKNKRNIVSSSLLMLSLLSPITMNSCSKYHLEREEDIFEKIDTTNNEDNNDKSNFDVAIDSTSVKEYTFYI